MKQILLIMLGTLFSTGMLTVKAQYIPNGGFEEWETRVLYEEPENWNTGNMEALLYNIQTATLTEDSYSGNSAILLETLAGESGVAMGYATTNGTITNGSGPIIEYIGGFPISGIPDSLFGYFKYDLVTDDSAFILVSFKFNGSVIGQDLFPLTGTQSTYMKYGWEISTMAGTPDTVLIGITSSNPFNTQAGSWVQADSLWFGGISDSIPNCDFEVWEDETYDEPADHISANLITHFFGGDASATQTTDANSGDYALSLTAVETSLPGGGGMTDIVASYLIPYVMDDLSIDDIPTFPVDFSPTEFTGYYKFMPTLNDTAIVVVRAVVDEDTMYDIPYLLLATSDYTQFTVDLTDSTDEFITEIGYLFSTTIYFGIGDGGAGEVGSELIIDDINLVNPCDLISWDGLTVIPPASCDDNYSLLDAGDGWSKYLWSTDETTQTIQAESGVFSVTVTDTTLGCGLTDTVEVSQLNCPCDGIEYEGIEIIESECYSVLDAGEGWDDYLWSTGETMPVITVSESGNYSVTVTHSSSGCELSDEVTVSVPICDNIVNIDHTKASTSIYPNPSEGEFVVELNNFKPGEYLVEIISITGKSLVKHAIQSTSEKHKLQINLSGYPQGLYMVKITGKNYSHYERMMLE